MTITPPPALPNPQPERHGYLLPPKVATMTCGGCDTTAEFTLRITPQGTIELAVVLAEASALGWGHSPRTGYLCPRCITAKETPPHADQE